MLPGIQTMQERAGSTEDSAPTLKLSFPHDTSVILGPHHWVSPGSSESLRLSLRAVQSKVWVFECLSVADLFHSSADRNFGCFCQSLIFISVTLSNADLVLACVKLVVVVGIKITAEWKGGLETLKTLRLWAESNSQITHWTPANRKNCTQTASHNILQHGYILSIWLIILKAYYTISTAGKLPFAYVYCVLVNPSCPYAPLSLMAPTTGPSNTVAFNNVFREQLW